MNLHTLMLRRGTERLAPGTLAPCAAKVIIGQFEYFELLKEHVESMGHVVEYSEFSHHVITCWQDSKSWVYLTWELFPQITD